MSPHTLSMIGYTRRTHRGRGRAYRREAAARATARRNRYVQLAAMAEAGTLTRRLDPPPCQTRITRTTFGAGQSWQASCACGWEQPNPSKAERYAKGSATRHINQVTARYCATLVAA